jgi:vitamin B12 transporter
LKSAIVFLFLVSFICIPVSSQQTEPGSVHLIQEVTVVETNARFFCEDKPTFHVDPHIMQQYEHGSLGDILSSYSPAMVRSYGPSGSLASFSLHGTGTNHTQVNWNGFTINSPTTGQADLSLIPAGFVQQIDVISGASGALFGSGTFGGTVNMVNKPDWNNRIGIAYTIDGGSFGTLYNRVTARIGNHRLQYHVSFIHQEAENDFRYTDTYKYSNPVLQRQHNSYGSTGLIQNIFLDLPKGNKLEAGCWYQQKDLELPALMGNYNASNAVQKDSTFKLFLTYRKIFDKSSLVLKSAYLTDDLRYTDKINREDDGFSIDSRIGARQLLNELEYRYYWSEKVIIGAGTSYNSLTGISNNYIDQVHEYELGVSSFLKLNLGKWVGNLGLRKEFHEGTDPGLLYSLGWRFKASENLVIRTNLSNKFRKPSFNEKYWKPGGNPDLRPEKGWGADAGVEGQLLSGINTSTLQYSVEFFFQSIDNWIQWVMQDSLTPVEYKTVHAMGIEPTLSYQYKRDNLTFSSSVIYNLNRSVITGTYDDNPLYEGKQLMYIPLHSAKINIYMNWKGLSAGINMNATGKRETVDSNDETLLLPGYFVADAMTRYEMKYKTGSFSIGFRVENLLNAQYEIIRAYPMPGRAYYITFSAGFNRQNFLY